MPDFEQTKIWTSTLAVQVPSDVQAGARERLRNAFHAFRRNAATLAGEIPRDLPHRTVHDVTHLDALWGIADQIVGPDYELTPTEAFVLGGAFLVHDLAMSISAYPDGLDSLKKMPIWHDAIFALLRVKLGRLPTPDELAAPDRATTERAIEEVLIDQHAIQAERLPTANWPSVGNPTGYFLIEDQGIRDTCGVLIGRIAHSHWWPVDKLRTEFVVTAGAPTWCPNEWTVNPLKLAAILRTTDACHLDDRRAPGFLWALRRPNGVSDEHWAFQSKLLQPHKRNRPPPPFLTGGVG